ncbi:N-acetylmuramoyl-L-alanine amidase [Pedobacter lithocola]|uniref:N-acetylmuramoyl-L-alanine amidase n=1 Tax=Pedobacter lithocola TaxID=1908239 RepID=A0ABV8PDN4_9SPHI
MMLIYLLKVSACTATFLATYQFLLAKLTFFKLNRAYLIVTLIISFIIPALTIESTQEVFVNKNLSQLNVAYSTDTSFEENINNNLGNISNQYNWMQMMEYCYCAVSLLFLLKYLLAIGYIKYSLHKRKISQSGSVILVNKVSQFKNCSFFNKIVVDASLPEEEKKLVIKHEMVHVAQMHSVDKGLVNVAICILWFNPIIYFWRLAVEANHEFLADEETTSTTDKKLYASLLLNLAKPSNNFATHNFSKLPLKKRITMMFKKPNTPEKRIVYLAIIPIMSLCFMAFINKKEVIIEKQIQSNGSAVENRIIPTKEQLPNSLSDKKLESSTRLVKAKSDVNINQLAAIDMDNTLNINEHQNSLSINTDIKALQIGKEIILIVDAGHGGRDGASEGVGGVKEKDLNLRVAQILKEEADKRNIKVVLTRNNDTMLGLRERLPNENATAFISIHHNSMPKANIKPNFEGIEIFVTKTNPNILLAEKFGISLLSSLNQLGDVEVRDSLKNANLLLTRESKIPAVIIEMGNISSEKSLSYFNNERNLRRICNLILDGFVKFSKS